MAPRFTEPSDLATFLRRPPFTGVDATAADFLLQLAENMIREEVEQTIHAVVEDVLVVKSPGADTVLLPELPVVDVSVVTELAAMSDETPTELGSWTDFDVELGRNGRAGILRRAGGRHWPYRGEVRITYSHGYRTGHDDDPELPEDWPYDLPKAIVAVCVQAAARGFTNPAEVRQETAGRWGGTYAEVGIYLTAQDKAALDPFRKGAG